MTRKQLARYHAERVEKIRREILAEWTNEHGPDSIEAEMLAAHDRRVQAGIFKNYRD